MNALWYLLGPPTRWTRFRRWMRRMIHGPDPRQENLFWLLSNAYEDIR